MKHETKAVTMDTETGKSGAFRTLIEADSRRGDADERISSI